MSISLVLRASIVAVALVGWAATPALAAPQMLSSDPEEGAQLHKPPSRVTITLSEPVTGESDIKVTDDCGDVVSVGDAKVGGTAKNEVSITVGPAPHHGTYLVQWYATGVTGGGSGRYTFTVHAGTGCGGSGDGGGGHEGHGDGSANGSGSGNGSGGGDHDGHSGSGSGSGSGHSGHSGSGSSSSGSGSHSSMSGHSGSGTGKQDMDGKHKRGGHDRKHGKKGHGKKGHGQHGAGHGNDDADVLAGGPTGPVGDIPTGTTVAIALGLAVLMGAVGGWVLRVATPR